jgi:hypothetical protein|tara:strand:+ start:67 stop:237 length:171 start_codon:yes stop_codon:yes gene_type:complete
MKKNKKIINFSKRKFNIYFLLSILFLPISKNNLNQTDNSIKKIKYNNLVWQLNIKD